MLLVRSFLIIFFVFLFSTFLFTLCSQIAEKELINALNSSAFSRYSYDQFTITGSRQCFWPILTEDDLSQLDPREESAKINCEPRMRPIFSLKESGILVPEINENELSGVNCSYRSLYDLSKTHQLALDGPTFLVGTRRLIAECSQNGSIIYSKEFVNFAAKLTLNKTRQREPDDMHLSLSIITLDSVSLTEFHRLMPSTSRYMRFLGFVDSNMFNKKNFNQTVMDLLVAGDKPVWEVMRDRGCISYLSDGGSAHNLSTVDFLGASPAENDHCSQEGTAIASDGLELLERFHLQHSQQCTFSLQTVKGFRERTVDEKGSERWFSRLAALDSKLRSTLEKLVDTGILGKTAIVVMGDLGNKHNTDTFAGRVQQSAPLFSLRMPHGFRKRRPNEAATLYRNRNRLTSSHDISKTLYHIARGFEHKVVVPKESYANGKAMPFLWSTSLFAEEYDIRRRCEPLGIKEEACQCLVPRIGRTKAISRGSIQYVSLRRLIADQLMTLPCIEEVRDKKRAATALNVFEPRLITSKTTEKEQKYFTEGLFPHGDIEYYQLQLEATVRKQPFRKNWSITVQGHVRHDIKRDKFQLIGELAIVYNVDLQCPTQRVRDFCWLCTVNSLDAPLSVDDNEMEGDDRLLAVVTTHN